MDIKDKVIIVTGASNGIGMATAKELAKDGAKLVLAARSADKLEQLAKDLPEAIAVPTDMRKAEGIKNLIKAAVQKYGRVDVLINDAGQGIYGAVEKINLDEYKEVMELNVYGVLLCMQEVIPVMREQGGGMILNVSSRVSKNYFPGLAAYASTKYALNALSLTARTELEKDNIIVSVFHPKMTATDFGKNAIGQRPDFANRPGPAPEVDTPEQVAEQIVQQIKSGQAEAMM
jgi:short-subunit dehydrogenase